MFYCCKQTRIVLSLAGLIPAFAIAQQNPATQLETPTVEVIGTTPIPGLGTPRDQVPSNVQAVTGEQIEEQQSLNVTDYLNENINSVFINQAQNNPFQPDVLFRGFVASPLLGNPIGLSVFVDGVRVNEQFGDTVNWDLIPTNAISSINLIPGSNPVFGLNTLGGSLAVRTKSGFTHPGFEAEALYGSFDRKQVELSQGGYHENFDFFVSGTLFDENGWRDQSPTRVKQFFGKIGWEGERSDIDLSYTYADNDLIGNGFVPESFYKREREAIYTFPDQTAPELNFLNLRASHFLTDNLLLAGNIYHRNLKIMTFNGDAEIEVEVDDMGTPDDPTDDEIDEVEIEAENRQTMTDSRVTGGGLQATLDHKVAGRANQVTVGATADLGRSEFRQAEQAAEFTGNRGTTGIGEFEVDTFVSGKSDYYGIYITDTFAVTPQFHVTASGRYNKAEIKISDKSGLEPDLNGEHDFSRFNPAIGATFAATNAITFYGGYNEGNRVPSPIELTCADPEDPCSLPVGFAADPPLDQVVARTFEFGIRGRLIDRLNYNATVYRTELEDDILFTSVGAQGFFQNVDETRRQGIELGLNGAVGSLNLFANYAFVDATFESNEQLFNPVANPFDPSQPATTSVESGDELPGIPRHLFKLGGTYRFNDAFSIGTNVIYAGKQFLRGDEDNNDERLDDYWVVNVRGDYRLTKNLALFARVDNIFDTRYETIGTFNRNSFGADGQPLAASDTLPPVERFLGPGQPLAVFVGIRYALDTQPRKN